MQHQQKAIPPYATLLASYLTSPVLRAKPWCHALPAHQRTRLAHALPPLPLTGPSHPLHAPPRIALLGPQQIWVCGLCRYSTLKPLASLASAGCRSATNTQNIISEKSYSTFSLKRGLLMGTFAF